MVGQGVARRYARALFDSAAAQGVLAETESQLTQVVEVLEREPGLARMIANPLVSAADKKRVVREAFADRVSALTLNLVLLLLDKKRESLLAPILREFRRLVSAAENVAEAEVVLAAPAEASFLAELGQRLEQATGRRVRLRTSVDPDLLGGLVLRIGDKRIDGSLRGRLARLRAFITGAPIPGPGGAAASGRAEKE